MTAPDFERRAIIATGEVQAHLGCPVSFHPGRHPEAPFEIIRLFQEAGGNVKKTVMSHLDSELFQMCMNDIQAIISIGGSHYHLSPKLNVDDPREVKLSQEDQNVPISYKPYFT